MSKMLTIEAGSNKYEISIPTYGELETFGETLEIENVEDAFYQWLVIMTMTPNSMMAPLSDIGIDYKRISDFDLFCMMYANKMTQFEDFMSFSIKVNGIGFAGYSLYKDTENDEIVLHNSKTNSTFTRSDYDKVVKEIAEEFKIKRDDGISVNIMTANTNFPNIIKRINKVEGNINDVKNMPISEVFAAHAKVAAFESGMCV